MSGIDPTVASALASRIDTLLAAVASTTDATAARAAEATAPTQWANTPAAPASNVPPLPPPASAQAVLSETALALDVISRLGGEEEPPPVLGHQPLWSSAPGSNGASALNGAQAASALVEPVIDGLASSLAMALEQALDTSGLFYESHLAQWLAGQRSSALLSQEPQARLPQAEGDTGWPFDPEQTAQQAADTPPPFTGRSSAPNSAASNLTGNETVDVEIDEMGGVFTQVVVEDAPDPARDATRTGQDSPDAASAGAHTLADDAPDAGPSRALVPTTTQGPGNNSNAQGPSSGYSSSSSSAQANATPTPGNGSMFVNSANAAYTAQAAASRLAGGGTLTPEHAAAAALTNAGAEPGGMPSALPIHPDALSIVRQQLELLQNPEPQFRWSGEAWPNSRMYWELDWDPDDTRSADQRVWRTRISLELPTLGMVDAELTLTGHQLGARITADGQSIGTLKEGTSDFMRALASAGLDLQQFAIRHASDTGSLPDHTGGAQ
jgi:Flagellar hook-length control protein FliK